MAKRQGLADFKVRELRDEITFQVFAEDGDPHETGHMIVRMSPAGVQLRWAGSTEPVWRGQWADLRGMLSRFADEADEARADFATRRARQEAREKREQEEAIAGAIASGVVVPLHLPPTG